LEPGRGNLFLIEQALAREKKEMFQLVLLIKKQKKVQVINDDHTHDDMV